MAEKYTKITAPVEGTFEGKPTISIPLGSGKPFTFGVEKAASIVKNFEAVKAWSAKNPPKANKPTVEQLRSLSAEEKAELIAFLTGK